MPLTISRTARRRTTIAVWTIGLLLATTLIARRPSTQLRGLGWGETVVVAAPSEGALDYSVAALHRRVVAGELIARLDSEMLDARRRTLSAEIEALTQEQATARRGRTRLFERDREAAGLELGELSARVQEYQARVAALYETAAIEDRLFAEGVIPRERALAVHREIRVVETRLAADRARLVLARRSAERASSRAGSAPGANPWQIEAARRALDEVEKQIDGLSLQAPISGQIAEIYRHVGEWLPSGEPVLRISPIVASEVHAWLETSSVSKPPEGAPVWIHRLSGRRVEGSVTSVGAERLEMPRSLWARSDAPEWGYLVRIAVAEEALAPGEPVQVKIR